MTIVIVGLGPGEGQYLTRQAWELLSASKDIYVRTERHPAIADLPDSCQITSFDHIYDMADHFEDVYATITEEIVGRAKIARAKSELLIYAVPGDPFVGEATVTSILDRARNEEIEVEIISGISFIEPTLAAVGVDALDGLQVYDAMELAHYQYPPISADLPLLLGQVYDRFLASDIKLTLASVYPEEHMVILVHGAATADQLTEPMPLYAIDRSKHLAHLTALYIPPLPEASNLAALAETVAYLRGPEGCPWDQEQTRQSMRPTLLEEATEVLEALDNEDSSALSEELGDLLYHIVMQAQISSEVEEFRLTDIIAAIDAKLRRRHPHVWGETKVKVANSDEVIHNWELLKQDERDSQGDSESLLDHMPKQLPSLARAQKIQERVRKVGFDWPEIIQVIDKVEEEIEEIKSASTSLELEVEVGDLLFAVVNWSRWLGVDAESALRRANKRFETRFRKVETLAIERQVKLEDLDIGILDNMWDEAKRLLRAS